MKIIKHIEYDKEYELEEGPNGMPLEPKCEECGVKVMRPKCFLELGGNCPRHEIAHVYKEEKLKWAEAHLPEGCLCPPFKKATDSWPATHYQYKYVSNEPCPLALHGD